MPSPYGTMWIHNHGAIIVMADGSAKWRRLGANTNIASGGTDANVDPYGSYTDAGFPSGYWSNGCHPWLFRPDFVQQ